MPHMADGPEQLEVENQCPTVSHDDVSRKQHCCEDHRNETCSDA